MLICVLRHCAFELQIILIQLDRGWFYFEIIRRNGGPGNAASDHLKIW